MKPYCLARSQLRQTSPNQLWMTEFWITLGLMMTIFIFEFFTPSQLIFGYLYTAPLLFASVRLQRCRIIQITGIAIVLTLLNLWIPNPGEVTLATVVNRLIASMALLVTGVLIDRNRYYQEAVTHQQVQIQASEKLIRLREDFNATLTHDLKTPLLGAIETLKAFQDQQFGFVSPTQSQVIQTMTRSHQMSLQLLETLLDIYRNDTEGLNLNLASVDLTSLAEETANTLLDLAASRRVHLSFNHGESQIRRSLPIKGDRLQLQRVFMNLLINAINHSRRGDRVEILLESQVSYQVVKILDTGSGIRSDELPHLFEQFYQGQSDRQATGTGLGLYLSRQIIAAHGGTIWAENRRPTGALFGFKLPINRAA
ncbi:MAG: HAMP domain-containing sensor histidine kinase [Prochlorothrix sp.]|nr:HAMP domain-containing sensor histidine kinase [Prochlorothrix sp.]